MPGPTRVAAALLLGALAGPALAAPADAARSDSGQPITIHKRTATAPTTPLEVDLTALRPSTVPRSGTVTLSGTVTNRSSSTWTDVTLSPFVSPTPLTTRDDLALAAATEGDTAVGQTLTDASDDAGDLAPGATRSFTLRVPRAQLPITGAPGVYWLGVDALGTGPQGRDQLADGRARTFIPLVTAKAARTRTVPITVVLPLRERARRATDGSLAGITRWEGLLADQGRLTRLAELASSAPTDSVTWLVDPAVLDALEAVARGNPALSLGPRDRGQGSSASASPSPSPSASASPSSPSDLASADQPSRTPVGGRPDQGTRERAASALEALVPAIAAQDALALGYSDPDVGAVLRHRSGLLDRARALSQRRLDARGLTGDPVVAPPDEVFDSRLVPDLGRSTILLLGDQGRLTTPPVSRLRSGPELALADDRASAGGPGPGAPYDALELRQRVLGEAALEAEKGPQAPRAVTVLLPPHWDPGARWRDADLFGGLQTSWTRLTGLDRNPTTTYAGRLASATTARADELPASNVEAARDLALTGFTLGHLLASRNQVTDTLVGAALQAASYSARPTPELAARQVSALDVAIRGTMRRVEVDGTDFSTLSGGSGIVTVSIRNGLDQPITVGLRAQADSPDVKVDVPPAEVVQPGQRTTRRLDVSSRSGVHKVTVTPVTTRGEELGTPLTFSLRTSQVGRAIWVVIIGGGVLLAVMIVRRIVLRLRHHRWRVSEGR